MTIPAFYRLRTIIPLAFFSFATLVALLVSAEHVRETSNRIEKDSLETLKILMSQLQDTISNQSVEENLLEAKSRISTTALHPNVRTLLLADKQHRILLANRYAWRGEPAESVTHYRAGMAEKIQSLRHSLVQPRQDGLIEGYFPVLLGLQKGGLRKSHWGMLYVQYDLSEALALARKRAAMDALQFWGFSMAIAVALALLLNWLVSRRVERLANTAMRLTRGDMSARAGLGSQDEIGLLGQSIDQMAEHLARDREALRTERKFSDDIIQSVTTPMFIIDTQHRVLVWNHACEELTGVRAADILGSNQAWRGFYPGPRPCLADLVLDRKHQQAGDFYTVTGPSQFGSGSQHAEDWFSELNGKRRYLIFDATPIFDSEGQLMAVIENLQDVTEIKVAEEKLRLTSRVIESTSEAILITDADNRIVSVNRAFSDVTGYAQEEVLGRNPSMFSSGQQDATFYQGMWDSLRARDAWQGELWNRRKDGEVFPLWTSISAIRDDAGKLTHYVAIFADISKHKETLQHIEFLAHHDTLTKLPNRLLLLDRLQQAMSKAEREQSRVALMFLDLDRFKQVNDTLGHHIGDLLLLAVVERLKGCVRETDTISRQGGDEFVVVLPDIRSINSVSSVAEKILQQLREPFDIEGHHLATSFSIGISLYPDDGREVGVLMQNADTAMYHAKESGRNTCHFYTESMNANAAQRLQLQNKMRHAFDHGLFQLHYQPLISLDKQNIIGCEALIRWHDDENGWISPANFIPLAEETGLILDIDAWVLQQACMQGRAWLDAGLPSITVAVNISALQFKRSRIIPSVQKALNHSGFPPASLEIELTESVLIQDTAHIQDQLKQLHELGVRLSIDDYGTGYSNLSYLKRLDVHKLKIDQSFVKDMLTDELDAIIVRSTVELAHNLGLQVLAEGVEGQAIQVLLQKLGCDEAQGFHIGRPIPADEFEQLLRKQAQA